MLLEDMYRLGQRLKLLMTPAYCNEKKQMVLRRMAQWYL